ncbi:hypothetical protein H5410_035458, partial [Solanum commersonii]
LSGKTPILATSLSTLVGILLERKETTTMPPTRSEIIALHLLWLSLHGELFIADFLLMRKWLSGALILSQDVIVVLQLMRTTTWKNGILLQRTPLLILLFMLSPIICWEIWRERYSNEFDVIKPYVYRSKANILFTIVHITKKKFGKANIVES